MYLQDGTMPYCKECKFFVEANSEEEFNDILWNDKQCVGCLDDGEIMCCCFTKK
jgi:hypothetical protein